jgi:hypothetical protein
MSFRILQGSLKWSLKMGIDKRSRKFILIIFEAIDVSKLFEAIV